MQFKDGPFPTCFMVVAGILAWNSFLRTARGNAEGSFDDFLPSLGAAIVAGFVSNRGGALAEKATQYQNPVQIT